MEEGSERISTPIRSPSEKDSVILSRASAASSPFGFRKVIVYVQIKVTSLGSFQRLLGTKTLKMF